MKLYLDSRTGGNGDILMRLIALYAFARILPRLEIEVCIKPFLIPEFAPLFADRLSLTATPDRAAVAYIHSLQEMKRIPWRTRLVHPFYFTRSVNFPRDSWSRALAKHLSSLPFRMVGKLVVPRLADYEFYSGYLQVCALPRLRRVPWSQFLEQAVADFEVLRQKLRERYPRNPQLPVIAFPSGTTFNFLPPSFGKEVLGSATFCVHRDNPYDEAGLYGSQGLDVRLFGNMAECFELISRADLIVATDSFQSHLAQLYTDRAVIMLSQQPARRVVHPSFAGTVIHPEVACSPCRSGSRHPRAFCLAGEGVCNTWANPAYRANVSTAIKTGLLDSAERLNP